MEKSAGGGKDRSESLEEAKEATSVGASMPEDLRRETIIVFDWDDTILPTSWLERVNALSGSGVLRPQLREQVAVLCKAAAETLQLAAQMGTVILITNSSPGWVDQSCKLFMPQFMPEVRSLRCVAKPMSAPVTFKIGAFRRECRQFANVISVGDGDPERTASLKMQGPAERRFGAPGAAAEEPQTRRVKSVKLLEAPTCQQLVIEHEMLQARLKDVVCSPSNLDLRVRFPGAASGPAGLGGRTSAPAGPGGAAGGTGGGAGQAPSCVLGHYFASFKSQMPMTLRLSGGPGNLPPLSGGAAGGGNDLDEWLPGRQPPSPAGSPISERGGLTSPAGGGAAAVAAVRAGLLGSTTVLVTGPGKADSGTSAAARLRANQPARRSLSTGTLTPTGGARRHTSSLLGGHRLA